MKDQIQALANYEANKSNYINHLIVLCFLSSLLLFFSPLLSLISSIFLIKLADSVRAENPFKIYLSINIVLALSITLSSANLPPIAAQSDDFARYYYFYLKIFNGETTILDFDEFGTFEPGLLVYFKFLSIFPQMSYQEYSFVTSIVFYLIFLNWIIRYGISKKNRRFAGFIIAISLILIPNALILQLTRQAFSILFILYAISSQRTNLVLLNLIIATLFHLSAVPMFLIILFIRRFKFIGLLLSTLLMIMLNTYLSSYIEDLSFIPKISSFQDLDRFDGAGVNFGGLLWIILMYVYGVLALLSRNSFNDFLNSLKNIGGIYAIIFFTLFYLIFFEIPLVSTRVTLLYFSLLLGYLFSMITVSSDFKKFDFAILSVFAFYVLEKYLSNSFWQSFEFMNWFPGYFLVL